MIVRKNNNAIEISFQYDSQIISFVKSLEGRKYNPATKCWYIPLAGSHASIDRLAKKGFTIHPELWAEVRKDQEQAREAEALAILPDIEFESGLSAIKLYPFQKVVSAFMIKTESCLNACGVRTGKTIMTLAVIQKNNTKKNLIIVPGSVIYQWKEEINRVLPAYKIFIVIGTARERLKIYEQIKKCEDYFFLIISYDIIRIDREVIENI